MGMGMGIGCAVDPLGKYSARAGVCLDKCRRLQCAGRRTRCVDRGVLGVAMIGKEQALCIDGKFGLELNVLKMGSVKLMVCWSAREERRIEPGEMVQIRSDHLSLGRLCYDYSFFPPRSLLSYCFSYLEGEFKQYHKST